VPRRSDSHRYRPVLPCVQHTGVSGDQLIQQSSARPAEPQNAASRRLTIALAVISASQLMVVLDATIVTVALPSIRTALHFSPVNLEWTISAYTLVFGGFLLLGGRLGDVFGRRRVFVAGLVIFTLASFAGGLATTSAWLVTCRAVQGLGAAITAPGQLRDLAPAATLHGYTTAFVVGACIALVAFVVALAAVRPPCTFRIASAAGHRT